jgi:hypothetical protein
MSIPIYERIQMQIWYYTELELQDNGYTYIWHKILLESYLSLDNISEIN